MRRGGFALAELMIALLLLAVVGGAIHAGLRRQQQLFRSLAVMIATRADVRDAAEVLAADLSSASPLDTLPIAADSAIEFYATIVSSISCDSAPGYTVRMPPEGAQSGPRLTVVSATPDTGDVMLIYNDDSLLVADPRWDRHIIAAVSSQSAGVACPASTGLTAIGDAAAPSSVITLRGPAHAGVRRGAPVRILRRGRYSLYRSSDSRWYLGHRRCNSSSASACGLIQPLSGPYNAYAQGGRGGLALRYLDAEGAPLDLAAARNGAARIELVVRANASRPIHLGGVLPAQFGDSAAMSIALRNRD